MGDTDPKFCLNKRFKFETKTRVFFSPYSVPDRDGPWPDPTRPGSKHFESDPSLVPDSTCNVLSIAPKFQISLLTLHLIFTSQFLLLIQQSSDTQTLFSSTDFCHIYKLNLKTFNPSWCRKWKLQLDSMQNLNFVLISE